MNKSTIITLETFGYFLLVLADWKIAAGVFVVVCAHMAHKHFDKDKL